MFKDDGCGKRKVKRSGGLAQLARAPALHAGGQRFDSVILHYSRFSRFSDLIRVSV